MELKTYDRIEGETTKAYAAFTVYRDMGVARSLDKVAAEIYGAQVTGKRHTHRTTLNRWSSQNNWVDRCREFDLDEEKRQRDRMRAENDEQYFQKIESYRANVEGVGMGLLALSAKYLVSIDRRSRLIFSEIEAACNENRSPDLTEVDENFFLQLPSMLRSISLSCLGGNDLAGDGLGIRKLINERDEFLDNSHN